MILVIDNYDSFTYNLVQMLGLLGAEVRVERNDAVTPAQVVAMAPRGIVVSPGPGAPDGAGESEAIIAAAADCTIPLLGVCLGHQAIAEVFGGKVVRADEVMHGKTSSVRHTGAGVMRGLPPQFTATRYHSLIVERTSLPPCLEVTAEAADGVVMALQHIDKPVFGVQFHPESVLTPEGIAILRNFLEIAGEIDPVETAAEVVVRQMDRDVPVTVPAAIGVAASGGSLTEEEASSVMGLVMDGEATPAQIASLITALRMKGETVDEITGFARAMRARVTPVHPRSIGLLDTCGTGGDGLSTFNISTATAFVVAGAGVPVAKHGNRAVSSKSGSADVLEALGVRIDLSADEAARCIDEVGVGFLFAQALHSSMRHAGGPRREIAIRTVFNLLGPLTNPAGARRQLLGVYDPRLVPVMAEVAGRLGAERVMVVHGHPGIDEVSASGPTTVAEFVGGKVRVYEIDPESVGIRLGPASSMAGGDASRNAGILRAVLAGGHGVPRDVVVLNAAAALLVAGHAEDLAEGVVLARRSIDDGCAFARLEALLALTSRLGAEADARKAQEVPA